MANIYQNYINAAQGGGGDGTIPDFTPATAYAQYAPITENGILYRARFAFTSAAAFDINDWELVYVTFGGYDEVITTSPTVDASIYNYCKLAVTGALTVSFPNVRSQAYTCVLEITNGSSGAITWPSPIVWQGSSAPTLASFDVVILTTSDGGASWYGTYNENLQPQITTNTNDISTLNVTTATHTSEIATLDTDTSTNTTDITNLTTTVGTNTTNIATNATDITNLDTRVTTNEGNITTNTTNITTNATNIANNTTAIADAAITVALDWMPTTVYKEDEVVIEAGLIYRALTDFTSGATFDPSDFELLSTVATASPTVANDFVGSAMYAQYELINEGGELWRANIAFTAGASFVAGDWEQLTNNTGGGSVAAVDVTYDNTTSGLTAVDAQAALDEIDSLVDTNTTDIGNNTTNIGTNTTDITNLTTTVGTNTTNITTNANAITALQNAATGIDDWAAATAYLTNDVVLESGLVYRSLSDRTSGATFDVTEKANWLAVGVEWGSVSGTQQMGGYVETIGTTATVDASLVNYIQLTITGATTIVVSNVPVGAFSVTLDLTDADTNVTFPTGTIWSQKTEPTWSTTGRDLAVLTTTDQGTTWLGTGSLDFG